METNVRYSVVLAVQSWILGDKDREVRTERITTIRISADEEQIMQTYKEAKDLVEPLRMYKHLFQKEGEN